MSEIEYVDNLDGNETHEEEWLTKEEFEDEEDYIGFSDWDELDDWTYEDMKIQENLYKAENGIVGCET